VQLVTGLDVRPPLAVVCDEQLSLALIATACRVTAGKTKARQKLACTARGSLLFCGPEVERGSAICAMPDRRRFALKVVTVPL